MLETVASKVLWSRSCLALAKPCTKHLSILLNAVHINYSRWTTPISAMYNVDLTIFIYIHICIHNCLR